MRIDPSDNLIAIALCWLAVLVCSSSAALALQGRVVRPDGSPVAGATVSVLGHAGATRTDADGRFTWRPDPAVPFRLLVLDASGRTMAPVLVTRVPADGPLRVEVKPSVHESTVTVEAAPHIESTPAGAATRIEHDALLRWRPARLAEAVQDLPGVSMLGQSHDAVPSIRGLARGRTLLLIDGARITSERRAGPSASFLDPFFLDSIEVIRGPGSVAYGSDALGGIIQARTRRAEPGAPLGIRMTAGLGAGIPQRSAGVEVGRGLADGGFILQGRWRAFDDYRSPLGDVANSEATDFGGLARLDHRLGGGDLSVGWQSDFSRDSGRPTSSSASSVVRPREDAHRMTFSYDADPTAGATLLSLSGYAGSTRLVTRRTEQSDPMLPPSTASSDVRARDVGFRSQIVRPLDDARIEAGLDVHGRLDLEAIDETDGVRLGAIEDADQIDAAAYMTAEGSLSPVVSLSGGARVDRLSSRNHGGVFGDRSARSSAVSGFAALTAGPWRGFSVTGQVSRGFREPSLSDRYFVGVSGRGFVTGNPDLDPESSLQLDLALRHATGRWSTALYAYDYRIRDLIERFENGANLFFFRNRGTARIRGVELELRGRIAANLELELGAQAAVGEAEDGSDLDDIPAESLTLRLIQRLFNRGYVELRAVVRDRDEAPGPTERVTPGYATFDLGAGWRVRPELEVRLLLGNLLDHTYPASPDGSAPLAAGRSLLLTLVSAL